MSQDHTHLSDAEFSSQFSDCSLPPSLFTHEAHIRLAWINIREHGIDRAIDKTREQIRKFVRHVGAEDKYHETITVAGVRVVYHFYLRDPDLEFGAFIEKHPRLVNSFSDLLNAHYVSNILSTERAKTEYVEPDKVPFD